MSERSHSGTEARKSQKTKYTFMIGGTALVLLAGLAVFQFMKTNDIAQASEGEQVGSSQSNTGAARVRNSSGKSRHLARVNDQLISWDLVAQECMARYGQEVLDSIINRTIIQQACQERGIVVTDTEVDEEVLKTAKRFNLAVENWYQVMQSERKITPAQYRRDVVWPMLALRRIAGEDVQVSERELKEAFIRDYGEKVKAKMIMMDNLNHLRKVWETAMANPDDFEKLARENSIEPNSRALDGAVPPIRRFSGMDALEKAAFKMKEGEISGIIQVNQNYVILKCEGRIPQTASYNDVKESLYEFVLDTKVQQSVADVFDKLKDDSHVHNHLTGVTTGSVRQVSATGRRGGQIKNASGSKPQSPARRGE